MKLQNTVVFFFPDMSTKETFRSIFTGRQDKLEEKIDIEHGLLSTLETYEVITHLHRTAIEVTFITVNMITCINYAEYIIVL